MKNQPLVSIIMNCYNGQDYLEQALNSIISQTYKNWELIFWDNKSEDKSVEIFKKYKDKRFKFFSAENHTILYEARNLAIQKTSGELIAFLDTDDYWFSDKLEKQIPLFDNKDIGLVYGNCWLYSKNNFFKKKVIFSKKKLPKGMITNSLLKEYKVGLSTLIIKKSFLKNIEKVFDVNYNLLADFKFVIEFSTKYKFDCVQEAVGVYRNHQKQISRIFFDDQVKQLDDWFSKIKKSSNLQQYGDLDILDRKIQYMKILKLIYNKKFTESMIRIVKYPLSTNKFKLILILIIPEFILKYFRRYTYG